MTSVIIGTKEERLKILAQTEASNRLEDIEPAEEGTLEREVLNRWVAGEIDIDEAREIMLESFGMIDGK